MALALATLPAGPLSAQEAQATLDPVVVVGTLTGDPTVEFGDIAGVGVDPDHGTIFLFDGHKLRLSAFTPSGSFLASAGRQGRGPGEFSSGSPPVVHGGFVYVMDVLNGRMSRWELSDRELRYRDTQRAVVHPSDDVCATDDYIFQLYYSNGGMVQRMIPDVWTATSFGEPLFEAPGCLGVPHP